MTTTNSLQSNLTAVTEKLIKQLQLFTPENFTQKPQEQAWSAAEVAEHLFITNKNISKVLRAEGASPNRASDQKVANFKEALLNRATKLEAPETVKPTGTIQSQQELIAGLKEQSQLLNQIVEEKDLNELCTVYPHPRLGRLTRLEWLYFIIYHMERHCQQLEEIRALIATNATA
jgi:uncharacterized damage-inducible protein DinB